jgi:hypothetical protein
MKRFFVWVLIFQLFISCKKDRESKEVNYIPEFIEMTPTKVITEIDSLLFTNVFISAKDDKIFTISSRPAFIAFTDREFNLNDVVVERGSGPNALAFPTSAVVRNGVLTVLDVGNQRIKEFNIENGQFLNSEKIPQQIMNFRFDIDSLGNVFYPVYSPVDNVSIIKVNKNGEVLHRIESVFPVSNSLGSHRQVKLFQRDEEGNFIVIGANLPFIEYLDPSGKSLKRFELDNFEPIKRAIDSLEVDISNGFFQPNSIPMVIMDAQYDSGRLYIKFTDRIGYNRANARNLLVFEISKEKLKLEKILKFRTGTRDDEFHPANFFVDSKGGKIYAQGFDTKYIYEFELPK